MRWEREELLKWQAKDYGIAQQDFAKVRADRINRKDFEEYFELSLSGIGYILQNTPDSPYRRGIGNNDLGGRKITCDMSVKVSPEPTSMNNVIALEVKPKVSFFPNRLMRGVI